MEKYKALVWDSNLESLEDFISRYNLGEYELKFVVLLMITGKEEWYRLFFLKL